MLISRFAARPLQRIPLIQYRVNTDSFQVQGNGLVPSDLLLPGRPLALPAIEIPVSLRAVDLNVRRAAV